MLHTRAEFVAAIRESPADETLKLVYADWLEEHGESEYAAFVRAYVEYKRPQSVTISERDAIRLASSSAYRTLIQYMRYGVEKTLNGRNAEYGLLERIWNVEIYVSPDAPDTGMVTVEHFRGYWHRPERRRIVERCEELAKDLRNFYEWLHELEGVEYAPAK